MRGLSLRCVASLVLLSYYCYYCCCCVYPAAAWVQLATAPSAGSIIARRGHTGITVDDRWLVVFGGRSIAVHVLTDTAGTNSSISACWAIGGCHEEAAAGTCSGCSANATSSSASCACQCTTGFSGPNCDVETVDVWLSSVSVWDMWASSAGWRTVDADPAGTVHPVAWPAARYQHSAALFGSASMLVYGGYSQLCGDFCSDLWLYDMAAVDSRGRGTWTEIAPADEQTHPGK